MLLASFFFFFFFFNDTATTEIYTLSLHDALPISFSDARRGGAIYFSCVENGAVRSPSNSTSTLRSASSDRKSTRLNSSHLVISYAVFCLKKKQYTNDSLPRQFSPIMRVPCYTLLR